MYKFTLQDAKNSGALKSISGVCSSSQQFADLVNEAQRRLARRGDWFDTEKVVSFCISGCIIAWPRWVGAIRGVRVAGAASPADIFNQNYSFVGSHHKGCDFSTNATIEDINSAPCANEISDTTGKLIRYYVVNRSDVGKTIRIFGSRYGGQKLQEQNSAGEWLDGITIAAAAPYGTNSALVTRIDSITRDATTGAAYLYEYDAATNALRDLNVFEPGETNPRYRRSRIVNKPPNCGTPDANGILWTSIEALIKVEFVPAVNDSDFLLIDNFDALKFMIQAIKMEEANDEQGAEIKIAKAIRELNFELRDKNSAAQTPVFVNAVMGGKIRSPI